MIPILALLLISFVACDTTGRPFDATIEDASVPEASVDASLDVDG